MKSFDAKLAVVYLKTVPYIMIADKVSIPTRMLVEALQPMADSDYSVVTLAETDLAEAVMYNGEVYVFAKTFTEHDGATVRTAHYGSYRDRGVAFCPVCKAFSCERDVEIATGEKLLSGYTPEVGEVVQNHYSTCSKCGWEQAS